MSVITAFETGYASGDLRQHASRPAIGGPSALCGAGRIHQPVAGRFGTTLTDPCPSCLAMVAPQSPTCPERDQLVSLS